MAILKGIDFKFDDFKFLNVYKSELEKWAKKGTDISVMHLGYGTTPTPTNETIAGYVKELGMELAYYWFVYGYTGEGAFQATYFEQGATFGNTVKSLESKGFKTPFKLAIDVEGSGYPGIPVPSGDDMYIAIKDFINGFNSVLQDKEFIIYSYLDFSKTNFNKKLSELCDSEWISTSNAGNPFEDENPMIVQERLHSGLSDALNWCGNNWCGWQYEEDVDDVTGVGKLVDLSGFNEKFYAKNKGNVTVKQIDFKCGSYVKLKSNCDVFAAIKIPNNDKNKPFIINSINNSECSLIGLSELVFANELKLVERKEKNTQIIPKKSNGGYPAWDSLNFYTKLGLYIGTWEGYTPYETRGEIGYSTDASNWSGGLMSREEALIYAIQYIKANESYYHNTMRNYGLDPDKLTENQLFALYDAGYNLKTNAFINLIKGIVSSNGQPAEDVFTIHADLSQTKLRRASEWEIYTADEITFWNSYDALPSQYRSIVVDGIQNHKNFSVE